MQKISEGAALGKPGPVAARNTWVQTERKAHEAWAALISKRPRAAQLMHHLVACMGQQNAVVISQKLLAQMMGVTDRTVRSAVADLVADRWISVVKLNGPGTVAAYVVNDQVAWGEGRDKLHTSVFSATIVADWTDQDPGLLGASSLRRIPTLMAGEQQLPTGPGLEPPSQPSLGGLEPDLPGIQAQTRRQRDLLARLRDEFQVDVTEAQGLSGESLEAWLVRAERSLFERLTGQGQLTLDGEGS